MTEGLPLEEDSARLIMALKPYSPRLESLIVGEKSSTTIDFIDFNDNLAVEFCQEDSSSETISESRST